MSRVIAVPDEPSVLVTFLAQRTLPFVSYFTTKIILVRGDVNVSESDAILPTNHQVKYVSPNSSTAIPNPTPCPVMLAPHLAQIKLPNASYLTRYVPNG